MTNDLGATKRLAKFAAELAYEDLPKEVTHQAKRMLLDTLGCSVAGVASEFGVASMRWAEGAAMPRHSTVIGTTVRTSAALSACLNARTAGAFSADETFPSVHQTSHHGSATIAAAVAVCEQRGGSGKDLLAAIVAGYEVGARLAVSMIPGPDYSAHGNGLRPGGYAASSVLGAAAAAARAARLPADAASMTLGLAGMHVGGPALQWFQVPRAPMVKSADGGWHALTGVFAAEMADAGMTGYDTILDGETGLWRGLGYQHCDFSMLVDRLGSKWYVMDAAFKAWPCQHWMHQALTALSEIVTSEAIDYHDIEHIELRSNVRSSAPRFLEVDPPAEIERSYNFPHAASLIAMGIEPGPVWLSDTWLSDPDASRLRRSVSVSIEPESARFADWVVDSVVREMPASAQVTARGRTRSRAVRFGMGDPWSERTNLSDAALAEKFKAMVRRPGITTATDHERLDAAINAVMTIDERPDLSVMMGAIARLALPPDVGSPQ